jgi:hypothetical protein
MNDISKEIATLQTMLTYYKSRSVDIEYQFVLYRAKMEDMVKDLQESVLKLGKDLDEAKSAAKAKAKASKPDVEVRKKKQG